MFVSMVTKHPELGCYLLAGAPESSRDLLDEVRTAEELGFGTAFISERWNIKEAASLTGAAAAVTETIQIATAATNHSTRHPIITASWGSTMHSLSGGRFTLGLGRGIKPAFDAFGMKAITTAELEEVADVLRRLWRGEVILDYDGPIGAYPALALDPTFDLSIPLGLVALGPRSLAMAGRVYDEVYLHTYFSDEALVRSVRTVKESAERAGRDPDSVRVWSCYATVPDDLPEQVRLRKTVGRLATYLQVYGNLLVRTNNWDPARLTRFRAHPLVERFGMSAIDGKATDDELEQLAEVIPAEWLDAAVEGTAEQCAAGLRRQVELGADGVIAHGVTPQQLRGVMAAYGASS